MKRTIGIAHKGFLFSAGLLAAVFLLSQAESLAEGGLPPALQAQGWAEEILFDGKRPNIYDACGADCVRIETDSGVSMIGKPVTADLTRLPVLAWEWKIEKPAPAGDLAVKGRDDRAVALYVTFPWDPETATFAERLLRPFAEIARGEDAPGRMLSYVWGGSGEPGDMLKSPYLGDSNMMITGRTQADPVGEWVAERFDVVADHERAFGTKPKTASHVLLSADSDDTGTESLAFVRNIRFEAP